MEITLFTECVFEFIGTMILLLMGDGVCAACTLEKSKAKGAGWIVISLAWGFAVMCGVFVAGPYSGAHLNPAVTLGLAIAGSSVGLLCCLIWWRRCSAVLWEPCWFTCFMWIIIVQVRRILTEYSGLSVQCRLSSTRV